MTEIMLRVSDLNAYYGKSHVLQGVDLHIRSGEIVSLLGRNGVGRSTTVKAIMGQVEHTGEINFQNQSLSGLQSHEIARKGLGYVPENRDIFPTLTVRQNLLLGLKSDQKESRLSEEYMYDLFPRLKERLHAPAGVLSGGEQQMLTLCRTLMGNPELVMIDEPTEGLAPKIVEQMATLFEEISKRGVSILLVEQKLTIALRISQRLYVMGHGQIVFEGSPSELQADESIRKEWLEV